MSIDEISINGNTHGWGSIKMKYAGERFYGFTGITLGDKLTEVLGYSSGRHYAPTHRTGGKYEIDPCKCTGYLAAVQAFREFLAKQSPSGKTVFGIEWQTIIEFFEPALGDPILWEINRCKWVENAMTREENPDPTKEDFGFQGMSVARNGIVLYDDSEGRP